MKKNKGFWIACAVVVIALLVGVRNLDQSKSQPDARSVRIGALLSLTGGASAWGENAKKGIELAAEELNEAGGINGKQIEIVYGDTASDPKQAVSAFQRAVSVDHVTALIGPLNQTEVASVIPSIEQVGIPTVSPGFLPLRDRTSIHNPVFIWTDAESEAGRLAEYVYSQNVRTVGVIGTLDAWEKTITDAFVERFKTLGGAVSVIEIVQPDSADMKLSVTKIIGTKPDAIYLGTYYQFVNSAKEISNQGFHGKLYGIEVDDYLAGETSKWSSGLRFIAPDYYSADFVEKFTGRFGTAPGLPAGQSYDAANVLFSFLKQGQEKKDVLALMKKFDSYKGVSGELSITPDGRTHLPLAIFELRGGKVAKIESLE